MRTRPDRRRVRIDPMCHSRTRDIDIDITATSASYALGGEVIVDARETLAGSEVLEAGAAVWRKGPELPVALHGVPVIAAGGRLFVIGGSERAGGIVNNGRVYRWKSDHPCAPVSGNR